MKKLFSLSLAMLLTTSAISENWVKAGNNNIGMSYVDMDSIKRNGDTINFWETIIFKPNAIKNMEADKIIRLTEIDCANVKIRTIYMAGYLKDNVIASGEASSKWKYIVPTSTDYRKYNQLCNGATYID